MGIYLTMFAGAIYFSFQKFFLGNNVHGYRSLWRVSCSQLMNTMYNRTSREDDTDEYGGYNMRTIAIKYKDLSIMRKYVIPIVENYLKKKKEEGVELIWDDKAREDLGLPEKYIRNYFESSSAITLEGWQPYERHKRHYSCYHLNFVDLFFLIICNDRLMRWWFKV